MNQQVARLSFFKRHGKSLLAVVGAGAMVLYAAVSGDNRVDGSEGVQIGIAVTTAIGVYLVPLTPEFRWAKTAVAVVLAVLQGLTTAIVGGMDNADWIALVVAGLTVVGVIGAPAVSNSGVSSNKTDNLAGI